MNALSVSSRAGRGLVCGAIRLYQIALSPWLGPCCRYEPSCSHFAQQAVVRHGVLRGGLLALGRLLRCQPFGGCGYDPVP